MKKLNMGIITAVALMSLHLGVSRAADVSVSMDLASAYVYRGVTLNDGPVLQPGVEVSGLPVTLGVWGNLDIDDYDETLEDGQISEIDIYASYDLPLELDPVGLSIGYTEYTYPHGLDTSDTNSVTGLDADREISLTLAVDTLLSPSLAVYFGLDGAIDGQFYIELGGSHDLKLTDDISATVSATVAYLDPDGGESGFSHANIGVSASYKILTAGITYVAQIDDDVLLDSAYDVEVYGTLGVSYSF